MNITLRQLAHALALDSHGSFHRAARAEHISQPAFSRSIRNLELAVGADLFDRSGTRTRPTVFGEALLRRAREIMGETAELGREIDLLKGLDTGHLKVAMGLFAAELTAARAVGELASRYPRIRCTVSMTNWRRVGSLVQSEAVDLGVAEIGPYRNQKDLDVEPFGQHQVVFYCRSGHPLLKLRTLTVADLEPYPLAMNRVAQRAQGYLPRDHLLDEDTGDLIPHVEVDDLSTARAVVSASDALSVAAPLQIESMVRSGQLCALPFKAPWLCLDYGFIRRRGRTHSPATERYMEIVRELEAGISQRNRELADEFLGSAPARRKAGTKR
ncbi:MAG: LysR family transcriptional regulator [Arenimonas sp.]|nr:LysR family transcriptional regulator [Arenimonas sp.]